MRGWSNNRMKDNSKSAREAEVTMREKLKGQSNEGQFKSARDAKVTIEWETILKVREKLK